MRYFAYGANMDPKGMSKRCPGARAFGAATLRDHRLVFRYQRPWRTGVAHVEPAAGRSVWGVLWDIDAEHELALDRFEEVHRGLYRKAVLSVEHAGRVVGAMVYLAVPGRAKRPSRRYVGLLVRGARAHGAPEDYVADLRRFRGARRRNGG